ncbi:hypothetical protein Agub_g14540 [Astrephomene gubernaculifera]|uniref:Amino acid transporter transmembrane domain-containing protein n=1 Tax=Astrephomene gubernaculifera TaxID=47775 RepID=A0AAD3E1N7_9CHLO|nr:hypothetical protein Agub_g14540 [Astrephomene gubernaculifera]
MAPGSANETGSLLGHDSSALKQPLLSDEPQVSSHTAHDNAERGQACDAELSQTEQCCKGARRCSTLQTTAALLTLQLGWGLWLLPCDFARLGWIPGFAALFTLALCTTYSGSLFTRLYGAVSNAVLFGDVGEAAAGRKGRLLVYATIYSLDATRCIILHLAATQSLSHALTPLLGSALPLWQCSAIVAVVVLLLGQIRYLTQLSSFFMAGTTAQMIAITIVIYDLIAHSGPPPPAAGPGSLLAPQHPPELYRSVMVPQSLLEGAWTPAAMAILNMIFAYGGQFAYLEIMTSMKQPSRFSHAVSLCTTIMTVLYGGFGAVGYWSKGASIQGIVIFNMTPGPAAQVAAAFIFLQALAQYLVNLNCWTHNLLVLLSRRSRSFAQEDEGREAHVEGEAMSTGDHSSGHWLATTAFVASYSAVVAVAVPFFCTLVGFVTSVTYLACAYTLPAWFALKLLADRLGRLEKAWLITLIPVSLVLSAIGLVASVITYINEASSGEGM